MLFQNAQNQFSEGVTGVAFHAHGRSAYHRGIYLESVRAHKTEALHENRAMLGKRTSSDRNRINQNAKIRGYSQCWQHTVDIYSVELLQHSPSKKLHITQEMSGAVTPSRKDAT
jgi:hypothetical protein